jgi:hypothetical protein
LVTLLAAESEMVGTCSVLMLFAAARTPSLVTPVMMASTDGSLVKSVMFARDSVLSERLSLGSYRILRPPSTPDSLSWSIFSRRARSYAVPSGAANPDSSRSALITMSCLCSPDSLPRPQAEVTEAAPTSMTETTDSPRMTLTAVLLFVRTLNHSDR